jgi:hypothetical protein
LVISYYKIPRASTTAPELFLTKKKNL